MSSSQPVVIARDQQDVYVGHCAQYVMHSAFQPIVSVAHQRIVGQEGLARLYDAEHQPVPPNLVLHNQHALSRLVMLDRACREVHLRNFVANQPDEQWLFLNVHPAVAANGHSYGSFFGDLLQSLQLEGWQVVIEIVEAMVDDQAELQSAIDYYRSLGCLVALDDFGVGGSQFTRLWQINSDIVKLDRSLIEEARSSERARRAYPALVEMIHESGNLVVQEGIETHDQLVFAIEAQVDLVQGFYLQKPQQDYPTHSFNHSGLIAGLEAAGVGRVDHDARQAQALEHVSHTFEQAIADFCAPPIQSDPFSALLEHPMVARAYVLDPSGEQIGESMQGPNAPPTTFSRYRPMARAEGANWSKRPYFQRACFNPGSVQISRPYLSLAGGQLCRTLSYACRDEHSITRVVCCDVNWH